MDTLCRIRFLRNCCTKQKLCQRLTPKKTVLRVAPSEIRAGVVTGAPHEHYGIFGMNVFGTSYIHRLGIFSDACQGAMGLAVNSCFAGLVSSACQTKMKYKPNII